ncbi:adenosine receptor A2a-like isoform X2 [Artemia franciscana]
MENITDTSLVNLDEPHIIVITLAIMITVVITPCAIVFNFFVVFAMFRNHRLKTPSNLFISSLAFSDLGTGIILPFTLTSELRASNITSNFSYLLCILPYSIIMNLCLASVFAMVAIAIDRFTALAQPLKYNNLLTYKYAGRYVILTWIFSLVTSFSPVVLWGGKTDICSSQLIPQNLQIVLILIVYLPGSAVLVFCCLYIYCVAKTHAQAISSLELAVTRPSHGSRLSKYSISLATTVMSCLGLWLPYQIYELLIGLSIYQNNNKWLRLYLGLLLVSSSATNPWVYAFRQVEVRMTVAKLIAPFLLKLGCEKYGKNALMFGHSLQHEYSFLGNSDTISHSPHARKKLKQADMELGTLGLYIPEQNDAANDHDPLFQVQLTLDGKVNIKSICYGDRIETSRHTFV